MELARQSVLIQAWQQQIAQGAIGDLGSPSIAVNGVVNPRDQPTSVPDGDRELLQKPTI